MPLFAIHALDAPGALERRLAHAAAHRAFVDRADAFSCAVVLSGPLQSDGGEQMVGSLIIIEAPDRLHAEAFTAADPYRREGVWEKVAVTRFLRRLG